MEIEARLRALEIVAVSMFASAMLEKDDPVEAMLRARNSVLDSVTTRAPVTDPRTKAVADAVDRLLSRAERAVRLKARRTTR